MSLQTKVIGRTPTDHGPYNPNTSYGKKFCVTLFGCMWESRHDNNNTAPAVWDGGDTITPNLVDWKKVSGDYNAWLMNQDKPAQSVDYPFNGMGRVKLLKHVVDGHNLLYQDDFYKDGPNNTRVPNTNTVFEVPYEFELVEDITLPAGSILDFQGGSISAGGVDADTITGNGTGIRADLVKIFGTDLTIAGTWNVAEAYPEWWGAKGDVTVDYDAIVKAISFGKKVILSNYYIINSTITIEAQIDIVGHANATILYTGSSNCFVLNGPRIRLSGFDLFGAPDVSQIRENTCGVYLGLETGPTAREIRLDDLNIRFFSIGILTHNTWIDTFVNVSLRQNTTGTKIEYTSNAINFISCDIDANKEFGILIDTTVMGLNIVFDKCCIEGNKNNIRDTVNAKYNPLTINECYFEEIDPYNLLNIIELKGTGVAIVRDCERLGGYHCFFGPNVRPMLSNIDSWNIVEKYSPFVPLLTEDICAYLKPSFAGDVVNFSQMTPDGNGNYTPLTHPDIKVSRDLSDFVNGGDRTFIDLDASMVNLYGWLVVDFIIANDVTEQQLLDIQLSLAYYDDHAYTTRYWIGGLNTPGSGHVTRRTSFYSAAYSNKRFQFICYPPGTMDENNLKNVKTILMLSNIKLKFLNMAFFN